MQIYSRSIIDLAYSDSSQHQVYSLYTQKIHRHPCQARSVKVHPCESPCQDTVLSTFDPAIIFPELQELVHLIHVLMDASVMPNGAIGKSYNATERCFDLLINLAQGYPFHTAVMFEEAGSQPINNMTCTTGKETIIAIRPYSLDMNAREKCSLKLISTPPSTH